MRKLYSKVSGEIRLEYINQYEDTEVIDYLIYNNRAERNKVIRLWHKLYTKEISMFYFSIIPKVTIKESKQDLRNTFYKIPVPINKNNKSHKNFDLRRFDH
jgi:hypothetical protein